MLISDSGLAVALETSLQSIQLWRSRFRLPRDVLALRSRGQGIARSQETCFMIFRTQAAAWEGFLASHRAGGVSKQQNTKRNRAEP
eukprot:9496312-Pyramimonas_sp.AAC.1